MNSIELPRPELVEIIESRKEQILSHLSGYMKVTLTAAVLGFAITSILEWLRKEIPRDFSGIISSSSPTLASLIGGLLSLFSVLAMWIFVIWSLSFIPFIAFHAQRSSRQHKATGSSVLRWVQLYATVVFPVIIFAVVWNSFAVKNVAFAIATIDSLDKILYVFAGTVVVVLALWATNKLLHPRWIAIRLTLFSFLLYASLFLTYGWGYGLAAYYMLFGTLAYASLFGPSQLYEVGLGIVTYDLTPLVAERLQEILEQYQQAQSTQEEMKKEEYLSQIQKAKYEQEIKIAKNASQSSANELLASIYSAQADLRRQVAETEFRVLKEQLKVMNKVFDTYASEAFKRMNTALSKEMENIDKDINELSTEELRRRLNAIIVQVNALQLPDDLESLSKEIHRLTTRWEQNARLLTSGPENIVDANPIEADRDRLQQSADDKKDSPQPKTE